MYFYVNLCETYVLYVVNVFTTQTVFPGQVADWWNN